MSRARLLLLIGAVLVGALVAYLVRGVLAPYTGPVAFSPAAGSKLLVQTRDGASRDIAKPPGKLLLLHFWATWCPPCVEELPGLLAYAREIASDPNVELLAVSTDTDWKTVDEWLKARGAADLPVALDPKRETAARLGTKKFPETYVVSPTGAILKQVKGPLDWNSKDVRAQLDAYRKAALPVAPAAPASSSAPAPAAP